MVAREILSCTSNGFAKLEQNGGAIHKEPIRTWFTSTTHQGKQFIEGLTTADLAMGNDTIEVSIISEATRPRIIAAIYARVSTRDRGQTNENQLRELRAFAERLGYSIYKEC